MTTTPQAIGTPYTTVQPSLNGGRTEVAFVLDNVADWQTLAAGVRPGVEVVVLDSRGDGLAQMAEWLSQKTPGSVDAIHLLGHGSSGSLNLGSITLSQTNLDAYATTLTQIGQSLTADGDILLYGCDVAQGATGVDFIGKLAQATGADVGASTDPTGNAALGGNWVLEAASGTVDAAALNLASYAHVLTDVVIENSGTVTGGVHTQSINFGQTFQATKTGVITKIGLVLDGSYTNGTLEIYAGSGVGGTRLGSQLVASVPDTYTDTSTYTFSEITLTTPVAITNGSTYTFVYQNGNQSVRIATFNNNPYSGGQTVSDGSLVANFDLPFRVVQSDADTTPPTVSSVSVPANATYTAGQNLDFTVNFSENVTVTGTPRIALTLDTGGTVYANYLSGTGTSAAVFRYTVQSGNLDSTGVAVGALTLNSGTIKDAANNDATLTLNGLGATTAVLVDAVTPTFVSAATNSGGTKVILTYNEALSATTAAAGAFAVTTGGSSNTVTAVTTSGSTVELTLTTAVTNGQTVTVAYTDPTTGNDANATQDSAGNDAATLSAQSVTNNVPVPATAPVLDATKSPTLGTVAANLTAPTNGSTTGSVLVNSLIDHGGSLNNYTDANNDLAGIAITGVNSNGTLYYSTNGGTSWAQLTGTVSATSALTLAADANTRVYFKPNAGYAGTLSDAITFKAWDLNGSVTNGQSGVTTVPTLAQVGSYPTSINAYDIVVSGNYAYVANSLNGLKIFDISNPVNPTQAGVYDTNGNAIGVKLGNNYAYVADGGAGLQIINISNPASPSLVGTYNTFGNATRLVISGNYAYVADGSAGLQIINISNPASPTLTSTLGLTGNAMDVTLNGNYAYVADGSGGLRVVDITNPASPTLAATWVTSNTVYSATINGNYAYVANSTGGLRVVDISNPANPTLAATCTTLGSASSVEIRGNYAYVANGNSGLAIVDITNPTSPTLLTGYSTFGWTSDATVSGNYAFLATGTGLVDLALTTTTAFSLASDTASLQVQANRPPTATPVTLTYTDTAAADTQATSTGTIAFSDPDGNSFTLGISGGGATTLTDISTGVTYTSTRLGTYGRLYLVQSGADVGKYMYVPNNTAMNAVKAGSYTDSFYISAYDSGTPQAVGGVNLTVNITGANDAPVMGGPPVVGITDTVNADTQNGLLYTYQNYKGSLRAADAEASAITFGISGSAAVPITWSGLVYDVSKAGTYGTLYVKSSTGSYLFLPSASAVNALAANTSETFTVTASDGSATSSQTLTVSYVGVNDAPVITSSNPPVALRYVDTAAADTFSNQTGTLTGADAEGTALVYGISSGTTGGTTVIGGVTYDVSKLGTYGTLHIKSADGSYVYVPDASAINRTPGNASNVGDSFTLTVTDSAITKTTILSVNVVGANDAPVIDKVELKLADTALADIFSNQTGTLTAIDVDSNGATSTALAFGIQTGTVGSATFGSVTYDVSKGGTYGTLYVNGSTGAYAYVPDATLVNALGTDATDSFTITASDGATPIPGVGNNTLTVSIAAVNDAPVLTAPTAISLSDTAVADNFANQTGTLSATDAESGTLTFTLTDATTNGTDSFNSITYDLSLAGSYGTLYLVSADSTHKGKYVYVPDATKINALTGNAVEAFSVGASDGSLSDTATLTINLTGANDTPVLASVTVLSYTDTTADDIFQNQVGQLIGTDADNSASLTYGISSGTTGGTTVIGGVTYDVSKAGSYGTLYVASSGGGYVYVPSDAAMESLKTGSGTDSFTVTLTDGVVGTPVTQTLAVNLTGADDPTTTGGASTGVINEDDTSPVTGQFVVNDRDTVDATITAQTSTAGTYGSFSVNASGNWSYSIDNTKAAVQALAEGASQTDTFAVVANGVSNNVVITVYGVNDAPTLSGIPGTTQSVVVGAASALADFTVADVDVGNTLTVTLTPTNGSIGGLTDADSNSPGIQLTGTLAQINTAISGATFTATTAAAASISISVTDGVGITPVTATYNLTAAAAVVTTNLDAGVDATFGVDLAADIADGGGLSLREALNWSQDNGRIGFAAGLNGQTINLASNISVRDGITLDTDAVGILTINGSTLNLAGTLNVTNSTGDSLTIGSSIAGASGALTKDGVGTLVLGGTNTYSGTTVVNAGVLAISSDTNLGGDYVQVGQSGATVNASNRASLHIAGTGSQTFDNVLMVGSSEGEVNIDTGLTVTLNGKLDENPDNSGRDLVKTGGGTLILASPDNEAGLSGDIFVNDGNVQVANDNSIPAGEIYLAQGKEMDFSGDGPTEVNNPVNLNGDANINVASADKVVTISGAIKGTAGNDFTLKGAGTLKLTGASTFAGATNLDSGTLLLNGSLANTSSVTVAGKLGGSGSIGTENSNGAVTVSNGGTLAAGNSPGILTLNNGLTLAAGAKLEAEINSNVVGTGYDQIVVKGTVNLTGSTLIVKPAANLADGQTFTIINNDGVDPVVGTFAGIANNGTVTSTNGKYFTVKYNAGDGNDVVLTSFTPAPEPDPTPPTPPVITTTVDGTTVKTQTTTGTNGTTTTTQTVAPVTTTRTEDTHTPNAGLADIPLATDNTGAPVIEVSLPVGVGLTSEATSGTNLTLRQQLIGASTPRVDSTNQLAQIISDGIDQYVPSVTDQSQVTVRTITLTTPTSTGGTGSTGTGSGTTPPAAPIVIRGATGAGEDDAAHPQRGEALVIDARNLPTGTVLDLDNVEFAIIIGPTIATGGAGRNYVIGDGSRQFIVLGPEDDIIHGGAGNDTVGSKGGNDQLFGDEGDDLVVGGIGNDTLQGGDGNDILQGGASDAGAWSFKLTTQGNLQASFVPTSTDLADSTGFSATGKWTTASGAGLLSDARFAWVYNDYAVAKDAALLVQALIGRLPTLTELGGLANGGFTSLQLAQMAQAYWKQTSAVVLDTVQGQLTQVINKVLGAGSATSDLIALGVNHLNAGGSWADIWLALARSSINGARITDAQGNLSLVSQTLGDTGWSANSGDDKLFGGTGNDVLVGGGGNDEIDGGAGTDMAVYFGATTDYQVALHRNATTGASDILIRNKLSGDTDTVRNVEYFKVGSTVYEAITGRPQPADDVYVELSTYVKPVITGQLATAGFSADWIG